ncbi:MscL family protein [Bifidobacterium leontopitheci]|uniref:Large-conductance mechanosensitive channel n=1 Tax=Bifidobacterium leontopitheci TaxID=2650774 RepID=A0A6I1GL75_9BIFI|nr:MscL family protein [Bifidobacterium leontopitheci]KAB7790137.1 large conductance mechanosensitive channel protein MscL [Bifidobacterium leontopitheci]
MIDGFKKFISRGNMIDMAVGVVMGGAVTAVVNAIVNHLINPLIAMIFGKPDMDGLLAFTFNGATVSFGAILGALLNFLIIAVAVYFFILVPINKFRDMTEAMLVKAKLKEAADAKAEADAQAEAAQPSAEEQTVALLTEIRDELAKRGA